MRLRINVGVLCVIPPVSKFVKAYIVVNVNQSHASINDEIFESDTISVTERYRHVRSLITAKNLSPCGGLPSPDLMLKNHIYTRVLNFSEHLLFVRTPGRRRRNDAAENNAHNTSKVVPFAHCPHESCMRRFKVLVLIDVHSVLSPWARFEACYSRQLDLLLHNVCNNHADIHLYILRLI